MIDALVIACGNPLRGDDGVAHIVADAILAWQLPDTRVMSVHQLMPELIDDMKSAKSVVFVDAGMNTDAPFRARELKPKQSRRHFGHHETPENLLSILAELEDSLPGAWLVSIRGQSFNHGDALTDAARQHANEALSWLHEFINCARTQGLRVDVGENSDNVRSCHELLSQHGVLRA